MIVVLAVMFSIEWHLTLISLVVMPLFILPLDIAEKPARFRLKMYKARLLSIMSLSNMKRGMSIFSAMSTATAASKM